MIFLGTILSIAAIGFFCWLLFTLAVFALPLFAGATAGGWAYQTGAGWLGAILIGTLAAGLTLGAGDRKSTRLNSSHVRTSRMPSSA